MASAADELAPFELAFRDLYLRDIVQADAGDVRMGTFILCGAFIDALALTYSAGKNVPRKKAASRRGLGLPAWVTGSSRATHARPSNLDSRSAL